MTSRRETVARHKRNARLVFEKLLWLLFCILGVIVVWFALFIAFGVVLQPKEQSETIMLLGYTTITLTFLMGLFVQKFKNDKRLIYRWTRKALLALVAPIVIGTLLGGLLIASYRSEPKQTTASNNAIAGNQTYTPPDEFKIDLLLSKTNAARATNSLQAVTINSMLNSSAQAKCLDMVANDYWSHDDKKGVKPWHFITEAGYAYATAGENLAYGFRSEKGVVDGWMNSPGHKANILNGDFKEVGFGICDSQNYIGTGKQTLVVQHFTAPAKSMLKPQNITEATPTYKPYVAPVCTRVPIPYKTVYIDASYMSVGETQEYGGTDGYTNTCTADSTGYRPADYTLNPYDKTIYRGTRPLPVPVEPT